MPDPDGPGAYRVEDVAAALAAAFPASAPVLEGVVPVGLWRSHTSTLHAMGTGEGEAPVALIKVGDGWSPQRAEQVHRDLVLLAGLLAGGTALRVPEPLGWLPSPPSVCFRFVPGRDLGRVLRTEEGCRSSDVEEAVRRCGRALGVFHRLAASPVTEQEVARVGDRLVRMAFRLGIPAARIRRLEPDVEVRRRYGDFAAYNVRLGAEGDAWLIDHPSPPTMDTVHRDVAWFLFNLERRLGRAARLPRAEISAARERLAGSFLAGYAETGPRALDRAGDEALLALYRAHRALWTARKRLRNPGEVAACLHLAWMWRRRLTSGG